MTKDIVQIIHLEGLLDGEAFLTCLKEYVSTVDNVISVDVVTYLKILGPQKGDDGDRGSSQVNHEAETISIDVEMEKDSLKLEVVGESFILDPLF